MSQSVTCEKCGQTVEVGDWPYCPHARGSATVIGDDIPGGMLITNLGHEPVMVYSKSQILAEASARGLKPFVRHTPVPGTDKSPHTTRWI